MFKAEVLVARTQVNIGRVRHANTAERVARHGYSVANFRAMTKAGLALTSLILCLLAPWPSQAEGLHPLSIGVRARVGGERVLGDEQPEAFREYDAVASFRLPGNAITRQAGAPERDCWQVLEFFKKEIKNRVRFFSDPGSCRG